MVFTLLVVVGYYVGSAVAQNKNAQASADSNAPDGVMVIEEEYGVITPVVDTSAQPAAAKEMKAPATSTDKNQAVKNNNNNSNGNMVEETVTEEGYVVEQ